MFEHWQYVWGYQPRGGDKNAPLPKAPKGGTGEVTFGNEK